MKQISRFLILMALISGFALQASAQKSETPGSGTQQATDARQYKYETVAGDPLNARIYTLDNGLKVYLTVYKDAPRIQGYIAVAAGSKNDPAQTTGLAHYFEHMMFKGTQRFGTSNYAAESVLINRVDSLFEIYRTLTDENARKKMYRQIDSISFLASAYAIPNEYDKLMTIIGATGTNAFTSLEETVYLDDFPTNQLETWVMIQADRFANPVLRGFHTELETIYEEKNMTMTSDSRKVFTALLEGLFPTHPYGTQTTIGTQEHIKNPSMTNIRNFHAQYYVPNNMAIALSGDFNPDEAIRIIDKYFGGMKVGNVPPFTFVPEKPITEPVVKNVYGPDAANLMLAFRLEGASSKDVLKMEIFDMILSNSAAGLIDINLIQKQKVLKAGSGVYILKDYSAMLLYGTPKEGQTLEEVRDLLLEQIEIIKKGEFDDWLIQAIVNDLKLRQIKEYEDNSSRGMAFVNAFILGVPWQQYCSKLDEMSKITKKDMVDFANANFQNNYVIVYKQTGKDTTIKKITKNKLTPLNMNRDNESEMLRTVRESVVSPIEPLFLDYDRDIVKSSIKSNIPIEYVKNNENATFDLYYVFEMGSNHNRKLPYAIDYLKFVGTPTFTAEALKKEFYKLGCSFDVFNSSDQVYVSLSGLSENMEKGVTLFEDLLTNAIPDKAAWDSYVSDEIKKREDAKKNIQYIFSYMVTYGIYGPKNPMTDQLSEKDLRAMTSEEAVGIIKSLTSFEHHVLYYGSQSLEEVIGILNKHHNVPATLQKVPTETIYAQQPTDKNIIYVVNFDTPQSQILMLNRGPKEYNPNLTPILRLFNDYFGGNMNSVVFQEMREARALAYTAISYFQSPDKKGQYYYSISYIATQYDKMVTAIDGFLDLMDNMPEAEKSFALAKDGLLQQLRTERITKSDILWDYESSKKLGINYDIRRDIFNKVPGFTMADLKAFQQEYLKAKPHVYLILGDEKQIPFKDLKKYGKIKKLSLETIFGY